EIDRANADGVRFGCVLADAAYGMNAPFRQGLTARKLAWAVVGVQMIWPVAKRGPVSGTFLTFSRYRPKTCWPAPNGAPISWRRHERKAQGTREGPPQRIKDKGQQHLPRDEA